jgi:hypothetical protein
MEILNKILHEEIPKKRKLCRKPISAKNGRDYKGIRNTELQLQNHPGKGKEKAQTGSKNIRT